MGFGYAHTVFLIKEDKWIRVFAQFKGNAVINDKVKGEYFKSPSNVKETEQKGCDIDDFFISN
ncbi:MAG: hypothetical protein BA873_06460 [Desulfobulbaceae bacterium C00003063]|nr:MAG: hypothetical protein BA873_06460 [Desulfobulbaceae bacterium C00003063]